MNNCKKFIILCALGTLPLLQANANKGLGFEPEYAKSRCHQRLGRISPADVERFNKRQRDKEEAEQIRNGTYKPQAKWYRPLVVGGFMLGRGASQLASLAGSALSYVGTAIKSLYNYFSSPVAA